MPISFWEADMNNYHNADEQGRRYGMDWGGNIHPFLPEVDAEIHATIRSVRLVFYLCLGIRHGVERNEH